MSRRNVVFGSPSTTPPSCDCPTPLTTPPMHGSLGSCGSYLQHKSTCSVTCDPGFKVSTVAERTCFAGVLQGPVQTCEPYDCYPLLTTPWFGNRGGCASATRPADNCTIQCDPGYDVVGLPYTCEAGILSGFQSCRNSSACRVIPDCIIGKHFNPDTCTCDCDPIGVLCVMGKQYNPDTCTCDCAPTGVLCVNGRHYNPDTCTCDCDAGVLCVIGKHYNPDTCSCDCYPQGVLCVSGKHYNPDTCECDAGNHISPCSVLLSILLFSFVLLYM